MSAIALVGVYFQVSARYRTVARFPEGVSGKLALFRANPTQAKWVEGFTEQSAGDQYLRVHAPKADHLELSREDWEAYKAAGGAPYAGELEPDVGEILYRLVQDSLTDSDLTWESLLPEVKNRWRHLARQVRLA